MYDNIVSRETVRIALMITAINDLKVKLGNILNANVQTLVTEKISTTLGPEFSKDAGKTAVIVWALCDKNQQEQLLETTLLSVWSP